MPDDWNNNRINDHKTFWCPNGHAQSYFAKSEAEKFKELYEKECANSLDVRTRLETAKRERGKAEKSLARLKKRNAAGVCSCCNRTVSQLAKHMETQHPEFRELQGLRTPKLLPEKIQ